MRGKPQCVQKFCFSKSSPRHGNFTPIYSLPAQLSMKMFTSFICNYLYIFSVITSLAKLCGKGFFFFFLTCEFNNFIHEAYAPGMKRTKK